jgi:hypothetical protein
MAVADSAKRDGTLTYEFVGSDAGRICIHSSSGPSSNAWCRPGSAYWRQRPGGQPSRDSVCALRGRKSRCQPKHGGFVFKKRRFTFDKRLEPADNNLGADSNAENYRKRGFRHCGLHAQQQIVPGRVFLRDNVSHSAVGTNDYDK